MLDDLTSLADALDTVMVGRAHRHLEATESTNDDAAAWLADGGPSGLLVTADRQTAGRGRLGRAWSSAIPEDIYASVGFRCRPPPRELGAVSLAAGVGIRAGLIAAASSLEDALSLKWPNDLLLSGKKVAGILCEARWQGDCVELVIGFGINVGRTHFDGPLEQIATSLARALDGPAPTRGRVLAPVLASLERSCAEYFEGGFAAVEAAYTPHCVTLGAEVTVPVTRPDGSEARIHARALSLAKDGALMVRSLGGGAPFRVDQADVWLVPSRA